MAPSTIDALEVRALQLATAAKDPEQAVAALVDAAAGDRPALEEARNRVARRMLGNVSDVQAGAALQLLNRSLVEIGWHDPYQWTQRLGNRLRKP
ncbi:MAG: hypothetical protein M0Z42_01275 [Actinomycetota bacterium]|nr:hypothetical protein [Actinomycetota bacterium]